MEPRDVGENTERTADLVGLPGRCDGDRAEERLERSGGSTSMMVGREQAGATITVHVLDGFFASAPPAKQNTDPDSTSNQ